MVLGAAGRAHHQLGEEPLRQGQGSPPAPAALLRFPGAEPGSLQVCKVSGVSETDAAAGTYARSNFQLAISVLQFANARWDRDGFAGRMLALPA